MDSGFDKGYAINSVTVVDKRIEQTHLMMESLNDPHSNALSIMILYESKEKPTGQKVTFPLSAARLELKDKDSMFSNGNMHKTALPKHKI